MSKPTPCSGGEHFFSLDVVGRVVLVACSSCQCGEVALRMTDTARQKVEFTYWSDAV